MKNVACIGVVLLLSLGLLPLVGCGSSGISGSLGISGEWVVDYKGMAAGGVSIFDAAAYGGTYVTFSGDTVRMWDETGDDCTATVRAISVGSDDQLLDAVAEFHDGINDIEREKLQGQIHDGELTVVIAEIISCSNPGDGLDIFEPGQQCLYYAAGANAKDKDEMVFTFHPFGDRIVPLLLVRAGSARGKELIREEEERQKSNREK